MTGAATFYQQEISDIAVPGVMRYFSKPLSFSGGGVWGEGCIS
ncbi:hypothetical protein SPLC1_S511100 [Arthrospira platensis C1]|nr:hypothetical protein SPLC1_S511100 [Arthrospira platensis C1]